MKSKPAPHASILARHVKGAVPRRTAGLSLLAVACAALFACDAPREPGEGAPAGADQALHLPAEPEEILVAGGSDVEETTTEEEAMAVLAEGNTRFANDLYRHLAETQPGDNFVFSPFSISTALSMTYLGARGTTAAEMRDTLHFRLRGDLHHEAYAELLKPLATPEDEAWELSLANRLWGQQGFDFLPEYLEQSGRWYGAALEPLDFEGDAEGSREQINAWIEEQTKDLIQNLIPRGMLGRDTRLVLTNAVYLKAKWRHPFKSSDTTGMPFFKAGNEEIEVPFMTQTARFTHARWGSWQMVDMLYQGNELAMTILLPGEKGALEALEGNLDLEAALKALEEEGEAKMVRLALPKFRAEQSLGLGGILRAMGIETAFGRDADFSGMNGRTDLYVSDAVHKAFIDVDEEGTEAAAATAVIMGLKSLAINEEDPVPFIADHPFVYVVRHLPTGSVLFLGRVMEPEAPE